jgi:hypothetical protein
LTGVVLPKDTRIVRVEKELATIGFFIPHGKRIRCAEPRHIKLFRTVSSRRCEFQISIIPSPEHGFPAISDQDKYLAMQEIVARDRRRQGAVTDPITFQSSELLAILGRHSDGGRHHQKIREWLKVMTATTIFSDGAIWHAGGKRLLSGVLRVFDRAVASGETMETGSRAVEHHVWLSSWQLDNLNQGHAFAIDLDRYLSFRKHLSRVLVPLLHVWLFASRRKGRFEKAYDDLCRLLCLHEYNCLAQIAGKLGPSLDELSNAGYLAAWKIRESGRTCKLVFHHGGQSFLRVSPRVPSVARETFSYNTLELPAPDAELVSELVLRGIKEPCARRLLSSLSQGQEVSSQLEWGDHLIRSRGGIENPAGFYIHLIRENVAPQQHFESPRKRQLLIDARKTSDSESAGKAAIETAYQAYREQAIDSYISQHLTQDEYEHLISMKHGDLKKRFKHVSSWKPEALAACLESAVRTDIEKQLPLLPFDEFCQQQNNLIEKGEIQGE